MKNAARFARRILPGLALAALAVPAQAQVVSGSYRSMSKTEAILGGAPSALGRNHCPAGRPAALQLLRRSGRPRRPFRPAVANYVREPVSSDRPDVFNSVALSIGRSPLDARWNKVSGAGVGGNAGAFAASLRGQGIIAKLEAVNSYVNARVRFVDDRVQFGVADRWMPAVGNARPRPRRLRGLRAGQARHASRRRRSRQGPLPGRPEGSQPPRRSCRAGGSCRRPLPGARQWHRPDRRFERRPGLQADADLHRRPQPTPTAIAATCRR